MYDKCRIEAWNWKSTEKATRSLLKTLNGLEVAEELVQDMDK